MFAKWVQFFRFLRHFRNHQSMVPVPLGPWLKTTFGPNFVVSLEVVFHVSPWPSCALSKKCWKSAGNHRTDTGWSSWFSLVPWSSDLILAGWWFGCHQFYFPINIGNVIIPIDEIIFFRGVGILAHQPVRVSHETHLLARWWKTMWPSGKRLQFAMDAITMKTLGISTGNGPCSIANC